MISAQTNLSGFGSQLHSLHAGEIQSLHKKQKQQQEAKYIYEWVIKTSFIVLVGRAVLIQQEVLRTPSIEKYFPQEHVGQGGESELEERSGLVTSFSVPPTGVQGLFLSSLRTLLGRDPELNKRMTPNFKS